MNYAIRLHTHVTFTVREKQRDAVTNIRTHMTKNRKNRLAKEPH